MVEIGGGTIPPKRPSNGFLGGPSVAEMVEACEEEEEAVGRFDVAWPWYASCCRGPEFAPAAPLRSDAEVPAFRNRSL